MTHTLHPEIIDDIVNSMNHYVDEHMYHALGMKKVLEKHLGPYLLPPSQHLKDETLDMKNHRSVLLGWDKGVAGGDSSCDVYGYYNGGKFYITNIEHRVEDNEPLPEKDLSGKIIDGLNKLYVEEELKQSTPKIDWVYKTKIYGICVCGKDHSKIEKTKDIEATIQLILDKINSLDQ